MGKKCHSCFTATSNMRKHFCGKCGNATLLKCTVKVNDNGVVKYNFPKYRMFNLRGLNYQIPLPKGGHKNTDLVLRDPNPGWCPWKMDSASLRRKGINKKKKKQSDPFEDCLEFGMEQVGGRKAYKRNTTPGWGKRLPCDRRHGPKKRKNKKKR